MIVKLELYYQAESFKYVKWTIKNPFTSTDLAVYVPDQGMAYTSIF